MLRWGKLEISGGFLLVAAVLFYLDTENILLPVFLAAGLHELGHYAAVRLLGGRVRSLRLTVAGGEMELSRRHALSYGRELISILAGPGINLAAALTAARLAGGREGFYIWAGLNLTLGIFNLLPIYPLDGGRALLLVLAPLLPPVWSRRVVDGCSLAAVGGLLALGGGVCLYFGNFTLLLMALWLAAGLAQPWKKGRI